jgi:hypothetical protein
MALEEGRRGEGRGSGGGEEGKGRRRNNKREGEEEKGRRRAVRTRFLSLGHILKALASTCC